VIKILTGWHGTSLLSIQHRHQKRFAKVFLELF